MLLFFLTGMTGSNLTAMAQTPEPNEVMEIATPAYLKAFAEAGGQRQLKYPSYDMALHLNDAGMQIMANILIQAFEKILPE